MNKAVETHKVDSNLIPKLIAIADFWISTKESAPEINEIKTKLKSKKK
jgi:hypothetical protein